MSGETNSVIVWYEILWRTIFLFPIFYLIQDLMKLFWYIGEIRPIFRSIILCGCSTLSLSVLFCRQESCCHVAILRMRALRPRFHATSGFFPNRRIHEPFTRPGVKREEKMSICSLTPQNGVYTNSSLLEDDVKVRKCHAMLFLRTCMSRKGMWFWPLASK